MKIQALEINNFKGLKKFKIEDLPDFVVLTGDSGAGKTSILRAITYLKDNIISPDLQPMTSDSQCHDEISAKFELDHLEMDYLRGKCSFDNTSLVNNAYIKLNKEGRIIEHNWCTALPTLLKLYEEDKYDSQKNEINELGRKEILMPSV